MSCPKGKEASSEDCNTCWCEQEGMKACGQEIGWKKDDIILGVHKDGVSEQPSWETWRNWWLLLWQEQGLQDVESVLLNSATSTSRTGYVGLLWQDFYATHGCLPEWEQFM